MGYLFGQKRRKVGRLQRQAARCFLVTPEPDNMELGTWCWPRVVRAAPTEWEEMVLLYVLERSCLSAWAGCNVRANGPFGLAVGGLFTGRICTAETAPRRGQRRRPMSELGQNLRRFESYMPSQAVRLQRLTYES